jgi:pheromone shutdown-related protein TraB
MNLSVSAATAMTDSPQEPVVELQINGKKITLLGTAHVSRASADKVKELLDSGAYDAVAIELCASRHRALIDPNALAKMNLLDVLKAGKAPMIIANLALGAYQQRLAEQFGIEPGAEMRIALQSAREHGLSVLLIDREIGITLKRIYRNVSWWRRLYLFSGLIASVLSNEKVSEEEIEKLKQGDMLESTFAQFADKAQDLYQPLIGERDRYMAARLRQEASHPGHQSILAVIGAGHLQGIKETLQNPPAALPAETIAELNQLPPAARWPRFIPWFIVGLILLGFAIGFYRNPGLGWELVVEWVVINGGLAALGAILAAAHPLTIVTAFVAAPLTSLNPTIGAGMVTGAVELFLRKPEVGDFHRLRTDTTSMKGWWKNRVTRVLLVFLFSTLGSAIGTYVAGFRILEKLT